MSPCPVSPRLHHHVRHLLTVQSRVCFAQVVFEDMGEDDEIAMADLTIVDDEDADGEGSGDWESEDPDELDDMEDGDAGGQSDEDDNDEDSEDV